MGPLVRLQSDAVVRLPTGAGLSAIADGDFNHDNRRDLAICERNLGQVALYMRSAAGTYPLAKYTYAVGQAPSGLVSFNHDDTSYHADLMALSGPSSQWTMLRDDHDTTGNLARQVLTPGFGTGEPSRNPQLLQTDVNRDGVPDFVYTYPVSVNSFVRIDTYSRSSYAPTFKRWFFPGFVPARFTLADFNRSGRQDLVLPDSTYSEVHVVADFQQEFTDVRTSGRGPVDVAAQDIDTDQLPDLAIAYAGSNEVMLLLAEPAFQFGRSYSYKLPASPRRVLLADLNRDFYPELLVVTADNQLLVYQHNGGRTTLCYPSAPQVLATGVAPAMLQVAYLNDDAYPDIVVGCVGDNTVRTYLNRSFTTVTGTPARPPLAGTDVYPTLATDQVTVRQPSSAPLTATLLDEVGRTVQQQVLTQASTVLSTGGLPRGVYSLRLVNDHGTRTTRLILR